MVVVVVEMKEELVIRVLVKRKMKEKGEGKVYIGFGICEDDVKMEKRGVYL